MDLLALRIFLWDQWVNNVLSKERKTNSKKTMKFLFLRRLVNKRVLIKRLAVALCYTLQ